MTRHRAWRRLTLVLFAVTLALPATSLGAPPGGLRDISKTKGGGTERQAAANRYAAEGVVVRADELRVFEAADGETLIVPVGTELVFEGSEFVGVQVGGRAFGQSAESTTQGDISPMALSDWPIRSQHCFTTKSKTYGYMDTCFALRWYDGSSTYDWFGLHVHGTVWAKAGQRVKTAWVQSKPGGGSATTWVDWSPAGTVNPSGNCDNVTVGIAVPVTLSYSHYMCEEWNISKGATSGDFRTTWRSGSSIAHPQSRAVAFLLDMRGAENAYPVFVISWDFSSP